jgi:hypothetical protein
VTVFSELRDDFGADETGTANDYDFHDSPVLFWARAGVPGSSAKTARSRDL